MSENKCPQCNYELTKDSDFFDFCGNCGWKEGEPIIYHVLVGQSRVMRIFVWPGNDPQEEADRQMMKSNRWTACKWTVKNPWQ